MVQAAAGPLDGSLSAALAAMHRGVNARQACWPTCREGRLQVGGDVGAAGPVHESRPTEQQLWQPERWGVLPEASSLQVPTQGVAACKALSTHQPTR